jgi:hypothetical protein
MRYRILGNRSPGFIPRLSPLFMMQVTSYAVEEQSIKDTAPQRRYSESHPGVPPRRGRSLKRSSLKSRHLVFVPLIDEQLMSVRESVWLEMLKH